MEKNEQKTWKDVQKRYAMLEKMASNNSIASEIIADMVHGKQVRNLIIVVLMAMLIIGHFKKVRQKGKTVWKSQ